VVGDSDASQIKFISNRRPEICEIVTRSSQTTEYADVFQLQIMDFIDACRTGRQPAVDAKQGIDSLRLAEMVYANRTIIQENWYA
jgi:predicted dehydrogenase